MARAGNRDVTGSWRQRSGSTAAWAPLFIETTLGRDDDPVMAAGRENEEALFGLGLLSRWPISDVKLIELPSPERYQFDVERMLGRHTAIVATIDRPEGAFVAVVVRPRGASTRADIGRTRCTPLLLRAVFRTPAGRPRRRLQFAHVRARALLGPVARRRRPDPHRQPGPRASAAVPGPRAHPRTAVRRVEGVRLRVWNRYGDRAPTLQLRFDRIDELRAFPNGVANAVRDALAWAERARPAATRLVRGARMVRRPRPHRARTERRRPGVGSRAPIVVELWDRVSV